MLQSEFAQSAEDRDDVPVRQSAEDFKGVIGGDAGLSTQAGADDVDQFDRSFLARPCLEQLLLAGFYRA